MINKSHSEIFLEENPHWIARLSNGDIFYSDNEYIDNKSDWERLKEYCIENNLKIVSFSFGFRSNVIYLPENKENYYFARRIKTGFGVVTEQHSFVVGYKDKGEIKISIYQMPEVILLEEERRKIKQDDPFLI